MEFGFAIISNLGTEKDNSINELSEELKAYFKDRNYGESVKSFFIGVVCVKPEFEVFFKKKKPSYTKGKKIISQDGTPFALEDNLEYDIKLDFEEVGKLSLEQFRSYLSRQVLESVEELELIRKKLTGFDIDSFRADLDEYLRGHKYLN